MIEHIVDVVISQNGLLGLGLLGLAFALWSIAKYYMYTIIPQQQARADKRDDLMKQSVDAQAEASRDIKELINSQGVTQQYMCDTLKSLSHSLENTSRHVATHDVKSDSILAAVASQGMVLSAISDKVVTTDSVGRIRERIDESAKAIATVEEKVSDIENRIEDLQEGTDKIFQTVNEIKYMIPSICKEKK